MDFTAALKAAKRGGKNTVIPDIKCFSPKEGDLLSGRDPVELAKILIGSGAPVLSVVTEEENFGGSKRLLKDIASLGVPVLRKDFLKTGADIRETKALGASAVLLMYSCLDGDTAARSQPPEHIDGRGAARIARVFGISAVNEQLRDADPGKQLRQPLRRIRPELLSLPLPRVRDTADDLYPRL